MIKDKRKYTPKDSFFKKWSTEMAYVLGFIASDGCVVNTTYGNQTFTNHYWTIQLKKEDGYILQNISNIIDYDKKIYNHDKKNQQQLLVNSEEMIQDLHKFGFTQHKSQELQWNPNIPTEYISHFIRGYFDGDGSIFSYDSHNPNYELIGINLVGTKLLLEGIQNEFNKIYEQNIGCLVDYKTYWRLDYSGINSVLSFLEFIYYNSNSNIRLSRKYEMYQDFINSSEFKDYQAQKGTRDTSINWDKVTQIRDDIKNGLTLTQLSKAHNINRCTVADIVNNKSWSGNAKQKPYTAFGESKTIKEWLLDPRCVVNEHTLDYRVRLKKLDFETALSMPADKGKRWKDGKLDNYTREHERNRWDEKNEIV